MSAADYRSVEGLVVEYADGVLGLHLDRPERRNALNDTMVAGLIDALAEAGHDDGVRAIYLGARGDNFCGGADIVARNADREARPRAGSIQRRLPTQAHRLLALVCTIQVPVVCAVRGWAAGIGLQLAVAADFTVAAEDARLWEPFVARGFTPDSGASWLLPRAVGLERARQLLLLGRQLSGAEAAEWGLVHRAVPGADVEAVADELVRQLATGATVALGLTKWLLHAGASASLEEQLRHEALAIEVSSRSADFREGLAAFQQRRPPDFRGR